MIKDRKEEKSLDTYVIESQLKFESHFLMKIKKILSFDFIENMLREQYALKRGRKAHNPILMFKIIFLQYLYNLSTRDAEEFADTNIIAKCFLDLEMHEKAPDHTRIADFIHLVGERKIKMIFAKVLSLLKGKNLIGTDIGFIDSTHMIAAVDLRKVHHDIAKEEIEKREKEQETQGTNEPIRYEGVKVELNNENISHFVKDPDARFGRKSRKKSFFGYKVHTALDLASTLITDYAVTSGEKYDGDYLLPLIDTIDYKAVTADKGYDECGNHFALRERAIRDFIAIKHYKKNIESRKDPEYLKVIKMRGCGERVFSITKKRYGMERCRYRGKGKTTIQAGMTYSVHNIAQAVRLLYGLTSRLTLPKYTPAFTLL